MVYLEVGTVQNSDKAVARLALYVLRKFLQPIMITKGSGPAKISVVIFINSREVSICSDISLVTICHNAPLPGSKSAED